MDIVKRRLEYDSERSEIDTHQLVVKREVIAESLGYESGWASLLVRLASNLSNVSRASATWVYGSALKCF